jgi:DNA-binding beta-propeller fold protein YncE
MKIKLLAAALLVFCGIISRADEPYHFIKEIPVGGEGGWDYCTVDSEGKRLYVSHGNEVVVIDLAKDTVVGSITNTPGVHGLAAAPSLSRGFVSCGRENKAAIVDLKTLQILSKVDTGANPDGMLFEPGQEEAYMFNGRGHSATVIGKSGKVIATIPLDGKPEFAQADSKANRVYNNIEDKNEVAVIDTKSHTVITNWSIAPGEAASGMAIDLKNHRLFLGCENERMLMLDNESGKVVASVPIASGVDANAFDPGTQLAFASCGSGTVTIAHEDSPDKLTLVQTLKTAPGARTMALDPATHKIYLPCANYEASTNTATAGGQRRRPAMVPGSFKVLVYGMDK